MGTWALFLVVTTMFELAKSSLLKNAHIKFVCAEVDKNEKAVIASSSFIINTAINILFIGIIIIAGDDFSRLLKAGTDLYKMLVYFIPGMIAMVFFSHLEAIQQSHFDFKGVFAGYLVRQVSFFIYLIICVIFRIPLLLSDLVIAQTASIILGSIILYIYSRQYILLIFKPTKIWVNSIFRYGGYIFGSSLLSTIGANLDQMMTSSFLTPSYVAYYNTATRINGFIDIPTYAASEIIFPKMSVALAEEGTERVKYLYERMISVLLSFIIPCAIGVIIFPKILIYLIAGRQYFEAAPILQLYMVTSIIGPVQNQAATVLNSMGKTALCFILNAFSLILKLILTYTLLIYTGFYGASIATVIAMVLGSIVWFFVMKKQINASLKSIFSYVYQNYVWAYLKLKSFKTQGAGT